MGKRQDGNGEATPGFASLLFSGDILRVTEVTLVWKQDALETHHVLNLISSVVDQYSKSRIRLETQVKGTCGSWKMRK